MLTNISRIIVIQFKRGSMIVLWKDGDIIYVVNHDTDYIDMINHE